MGELNLHPPEHPRFPKDSEQIQDPHRNPTPHEKNILEVFMRYKVLPDFDHLATPTEAQLQSAGAIIEEIAAQPEDPLTDQDERVLSLLRLISDFPEVFGKVGFFLAAEIMNAAKNNIETSEFRRAFSESMSR